MTSEDASGTRAELIAAETGDAELTALEVEIEAKRQDMAQTISALETRLQPSEVKEKLGAELKNVEQHVKEAVREQLGEAKEMVQAELAQAKELLRSEMNEAEAKIKRGLGEARDAVKSDLSDALSGAKQAVRAATLGRVEDLATSIGDKMNQTRDTLIDTIKNNPVPALLAGVGLAWLLMNRSSSASKNAAPTGTSGQQNQLSDKAADVTAKLTDAAHRATSAAGRGLESATSAVSGVAHDVTDATANLAHKAGDAASHLAHGAGAAASSVAEGAKRVEQGFVSTLNERPLVIGAAAVALGAIVGFALPRTEREDALLGGARDQLLEQAAGAAEGAVGSVSEFAHKAAETAHTALNDHGG